MNAMQKKIIASCISALLGAGAGIMQSASAEVVFNQEDCGPRAESSAWFIDYSGTMQQKLKKPEDGSYPEWLKGKDQTVKDVYEELFTIRKIVIAKQLLLKLKSILPKEAGISVAVGTLAPHTLPVKFNDDFEKKVEKLPERLEVFGRMTNLGESLMDYEGRLQRYAESDKETEQQMARLLRAKSVLLFLTDGDQINRGRPLEKAWEEFHQKEPMAKPVLVTFADDEETRKEAERLAETIPGLITADAVQLLLDDDASAEFVARVFYTPCLNFMLSADTLFAFDKHVLKPEGIEEIRRVAKVLADERSIIDQLGIRFSITAHTDRIGTDEYNDRLSERRLNTVLRQLESEGADMSLFVIRRAEGERRPVTGDRCTGLRNQEAIDCLQPDRRVEIKMVRQ